MFVPITAGAQAEILYTLGGKSIENRLWFTFDNPPYTIPDLQGLADGVASWHDLYVMPFLSNRLERFSVFVREWETDHITADAFNGSVVAGSIDEDCHSANVGLVVGFRWPLQLGRLKRNKHYIPGVPKSDVDLNQPSPGIQDAMFEAYAALIDAARLFSPAFNWRWVVASAFENSSPRSEQLVAECIGPVSRGQIILGQRRKRL